MAGLEQNIMIGMVKEKMAKHCGHIKRHPDLLKYVLEGKVNNRHRSLLKDLLERKVDRGYQTKRKLRTNYDGNIKI